jgi:hypothetical protein
MLVQPEKCAFCPSTAKVSGEHVWSKWIGELANSPEARVTFSKVELDDSVSKQWDMPGLDMKANVVCKVCNETWMSDIESAAKVAMTDLILGNPVAEITTEQAARIANFAFKTAIISDRMMNGHFFDISVRYAFKKSLAIPSTVKMWLLGFQADTFQGSLRTRNIYFPSQSLTDLTLNVCTFFSGRFGFQVLAVKTDIVGHVEPVPTPPGLTFTFHPNIDAGISWPRPVLLKPEGFGEFASRWDRVKYTYG